MTVHHYQRRFENASLPLAEVPTTYFYLFLKYLKELR
jgi:hypothetical protein